MRILKKYPNRRLYDTEQSEYVTLDDVRKMILGKDPVKVLDSKTGKDLTRSVLLQIIAEQEAEGHEPLLTNRVLEQVVRFYGDSMQSVLSRYLEQSIMTFLEQQELYQRRMREVLNANPLKLMQRLADQNINFLRSLLPGGIGLGATTSQATSAPIPKRTRTHRSRTSPEPVVETGSVEVEPRLSASRDVLIHSPPIVQSYKSSGGGEIMLRFMRCLSLAPVVLLLVCACSKAPAPDATANAAAAPATAAASTNPRADEIRKQDADGRRAAHHRRRQRAG